MKKDLKAEIMEYWNTRPCGAVECGRVHGDLEYYQAIKVNKNRIEPMRCGFAEYSRWKDEKVLEVGCGIGTDLVEFAKHGAVVTGIDLSSVSVGLAQEQLRVYKLAGDVVRCDAESIPFGDGTFGLVWSWGVIHHTPNPQKMVEEMYRVLKTGGEIKAMLYHKCSLVCLQMYLLFGLGKLRPFRTIDNILFNCHESKGTRAYTVKQVHDMFWRFKDLTVQTAVAAYDIRYARDKYLSMRFMKFIPKRLGWYILVEGKK